MNQYKYSNSEHKLFTALGYNELLEKTEPVNLYRLASETAFTNKETSPAVDALNRGYNILKFGIKPERFTEEFDKLIGF